MLGDAAGGIAIGALLGDIIPKTLLGTISKEH